MKTKEAKKEVKKEVKNSVRTFANSKTGKRKFAHIHRIYI